MIQVDSQVDGGSLEPQRMAFLERLPHFAAVLLACATFPLIWVGGLVTTYDAGMAVPDWPTTYGYNMFLYPMSTWLHGPWGLFIEHGHRLLGSLAGILTILLNVAIWRYDRRRWMRWAGAAALFLVISQGLLGGMRVRLSSKDFARAHGVTGPVFFAFTIAICVMTSKYWLGRAKESAKPVSRRNVVDGWFFVTMAYVQLVLGAHLRHPGIDWSPGLFRIIVVFHVVLAFFVLVFAGHVVAKSRKFDVGLSRPAWLLLFLVVFQVGLGFATWRAKYGWPEFLPVVSQQAEKPFEIAAYNALAGSTVRNASTPQALTVTSHVAIGSLILATGICYATRATRVHSLGWKADELIAGRRTTEGVTSSIAVEALVGGAI